MYIYIYIYILINGTQHGRNIKYGEAMKKTQYTHPPYHHNGFVAACHALLVSEGFLLLGDRGNCPPPSITTTRQKFVHLPCISNNFISQKRLIPSLLSKNFHHFCFNCTLFLHTDHTNFSFTSCSIFMSRIIFYFEKGLNGQIHSFPDPHHLIKKI